MADISLIVYRRRAQDIKNLQFAKKLSKTEKNIFLLTHYIDPKIKTGIFRNVRTIHYRQQSALKNNLFSFIISIMEIIKVFLIFKNFNSDGKIWIINKFKNNIKINSWFSKI